MNKRTFRAYCESAALPLVERYAARSAPGFADRRDASRWLTAQRTKSDLYRVAVALATGAARTIAEAIRKFWTGPDPAPEPAEIERLVRAMAASASPGFASAIRSNIDAATGRQPTAEDRYRWESNARMLVDRALARAGYDPLAIFPPPKH